MCVLWTIAIRMRDTGWPSGGISRRATLRTSCPRGRGSASLPLATSLQVRQVSNRLSYGRCARFDTETCNLTRVGQCSFGPHKPERPGATPGPATGTGSGTQTGKASRPRTCDFVGSTPTLVTNNMIPWSNGEDACPTCRKVLVRFQPGSLQPLVCKCCGRTPLW